MKSPTEASVFGRPNGVQGSFDESKTASSDKPQPAVAPPDPVLAEAFGRPPGSSESLPRDPDARYGEHEVPDAEPDPWRNPESAASLATPALAKKQRAAPTGPGPKLGVKEVLLGRGIAWPALVTLGVIALLIGLVGGLMGRWTAEVVAPLNSDTVELAKGNSDDRNPAGAVTRVANAVAKSVVSIDVRAGSSGGTGSGFVIDKAGYILTNNHVVAMAAEDPKDSRVEVVFFDRSRVPARIVGRDPRNDTAVIKVDNVNNLTVSKIGDSNTLQIGQEVIAFGSPLGLERTVTSGIVSALHRPTVGPQEDESDVPSVIDAIQTDTAINPGNSGGPLVDDSGAVMGVNYLLRSGTGGSIGLGFAIPIDQAMSIAQRLIRGEKISHPQIGVNTRDVRNVRVLGAQVVNVVQGSPADRAGLREGDVVTGFGGQLVQSADELTVMVFKSQIGKPVPFTFWRNGRTFNGTITPASD
ncbi:peptidase S1 family protein [Gordonia effusa NBRC 100432]|uniref:Peptidase S1 family protein n=1 Tax=Gordonia effusa NBRC 100432 TaxID=1077974 RepID=H0QVV6_9ACTN|nr:trypsin-like peptidase domain-containing protein [Gordonia effusa]GAB16957.1 peptidase S1 family protein [Gordonia effusa NBRC 100432]